MLVRKEVVGVTAGHSGQPPTSVEAYHLDTGSGISILVWTYGATLVEARVPDRHGRPVNVVLRHDDLPSYGRRRGNPYIGATMGRYCRNVAEGRFALDGVTYQLDLNDKRHHIHGGTLGLDRYVWQPEVRESADEIALHLRLVSPDGDQGYPGELAAETIYRLDRAGRLTFEHRATTTAPTIVGLTNHAYWNLGGVERVDRHVLRLNADRMLTFGDDILPVPGPPGSVTGTPFDYRRGRILGDHRIDNFFLLDDPSWAVDLHDPASGRRMRIVTDQPGMGVYSLDRFARPRAGICLQTSALPDAPNRPDFPPVRLDPGETYVSRTIHEFSVE